jgi:rubrerythrin
MEVENSTLWKYIVVNGQLVRECPFCGYRGKTQPLYCPECNNRMRRGKKDDL